MIATSTCSCTVVVHIFFRGQGQVPPILRKIFLEILAKLFCMVTPPVLPSAPAAKPKTNTQQPAQIITSVNTNSNNGNLVHHVNRNSVALNTNNHRLSQLSNNQSNSLTALNGNFDQSQGHIGNSMNPQQNYEGVPQLMPSNIHFQQSNSQAFQTLPALARNTSVNSQSSQAQQQQSQVAVSHVHGHQQSKQLNNELNLSFNLIENDIKEIRDYLRHTRKKLETTDSKTRQSNDWKQVALVIDRTLFFLYIIANIVAAALMFDLT